MSNQTSRKPLSARTMRALAGVLPDGIPLDLTDEKGKFWKEHPDYLHRGMAELLRNVPPLATGLVWQGDGSVSLRVEIDYRQLIEQLVDRAKKAGWWVNSNIIVERQLGRLSKSVGLHVRDLSIVSPIKSTEVWSTDQVLKISGSNFDLPELLEFIPYRNELLKHHIKNVVAMASRFRRGIANDECVVYLSLGDMQIRLHWFKGAWDRNDSFGICQ